MQLAVMSKSAAEKQSEIHLESPLPHIFVVGDAADAFGAVKLGHCAANQVRSPRVLVCRNQYLIEGLQGEIAALNILELIRRKEGPGQPAEDGSGTLKLYMPGPPGIKVSLGLVSTLMCTTVKCEFLTIHVII